MLTFDMSTLFHIFVIFSFRQCLFLFANFRAFSIIIFHFFVFQVILLFFSKIILFLFHAVKRKKRPDCADFRGFRVLPALFYILILSL